VNVHLGDAVHHRLGAERLDDEDELFHVSYQLVLCHRWIDG
jgi:hypothetical protein